MRNRHEGFRGTARRAAPLLVLRTAALLAVVMWVLPLCTHASSDAFPTSAPTKAGMRVSPQESPGAVVGHLCPDRGPGGEHCRPSAEAVTGAAPSQPVPSLRARDVVPAATLPGDRAARGVPHREDQTPGIHQLQVQRT